MWGEDFSQWSGFSHRHRQLPSTGYLMISRTVQSICKPTGRTPASVCRPVGLGTRRLARFPVRQESLHAHSADADHRRVVLARVGRPLLSHLHSWCMPNDGIFSSLHRSPSSIAYMGILPFCHDAICRPPLPLRTKTAMQGMRSCMIFACRFRTGPCR